MTNHEFRKLVESKILYLDGGTGSNLQESGMPTGVCPEQWILENPQVLIDLQKNFLLAGTDILFAPTFTANRIKLEEYGLQDQIKEMNQSLIQLSKQAIEQYRKETGSKREIYIAADIAMTGQQVYPIGTLTFEELIGIYKEQLLHIIAEGVDLIGVETMMSLQECRATLLAAKEICDIPVMITLTFNETGRTFYGTDPRTAVVVLQSLGAAAVGVNCSSGPDQMYEIIEEMKSYAKVPIIAKPNAGIPYLEQGKTIFPMEGKEFAEEMYTLWTKGADILGGCCGTTPFHIGCMVERLKEEQPRKIVDNSRRVLSTERQVLDINLNGNFMVVGERINPTGKKVFQEKLREGDYSMAVDMAAEQVELGADILDLNLGMNGIDEQETMIQVMHEVMGAVDVPLCIDSSHISVIEAALRLYPGRALINSISLETEKFEKLIPIAKKYGAMFILLPLSDRGLPKDLEEKKSIIGTILDRAYDNGLTKEDIIVDGLVNTIGANDRAYYDAIETIRYCKEELGLATIVGLSNISFGLPERSFINSTFLAFAIQAGLTMAIANPSQDLLMNTALAADLLRGKEDGAKRYIDRVTTRPATITTPSREQKARDNQQDEGAGGKKEGVVLTEKKPHEIIREAIVKGNRKQIVALVKEDMERGTKPGDMIDQVLIPAITEVGRLYDQQIYFLPQLIGGAEAMKRAIDYLEPMLEQSGEAVSKGTIVIATVAGDIHDIGKNLVGLMLKNYGYRIIDLGKDVKCDKIIETAKEEKADVIALSALMTTTMMEMKHVVDEAKAAGLTCKIIIGGAVITQGYADEISADGYSTDAQSAVKLVRSFFC